MHEHWRLKSFLVYQRCLQKDASVCKLAFPPHLEYCTTPSSHSQSSPCHPIIEKPPNLIFVSFMLQLPVAESLCPPVTYSSLIAQRTRLGTREPRWESSGSSGKLQGHHIPKQGPFHYPSQTHLKTSPKLRLQEHRSDSVCAHSLGDFDV